MEFPHEIRVDDSKANSSKDKETLSSAPLNGLAENPQIYLTVMESYEITGTTSLPIFLFQLANYPCAITTAAHNLGMNIKEANSFRQNPKYHLIHLFNSRVRSQSALIIL